MGREADDDSNRAKVIKNLTERLSRPKVRYTRSIQINNGEGFQSIRRTYQYGEEKPVKAYASTRPEYQQDIIAMSYASENGLKKATPQSHRILRHQKSRSDAASMMITGNQCLVVREKKPLRGLF